MKQNTKKLIIIPTRQELKLFLERFISSGYSINNIDLGILQGHEIHDLDLVIFLGGFGKVQFGIQTQHLIDAYENWNLVICLGAAGSLTNRHGFGDIIIGTETIEHDFKKIGKPITPKFNCSENIILELKEVIKNSEDLQHVHIGPIASGDEDIMSDRRKKELNTKTNALAVAWEGAGCGRACAFSSIPFIEIRGIADSANKEAVTDFKHNLQIVMTKLADFIINWLS